MSATGSAAQKTLTYVVGVCKMVTGSSCQYKSRLYGRACPNNTHEGSPAAFSTLLFRVASRFEFLPWSLHASNELIKCWCRYADLHRVKVLNVKVDWIFTLYRETKTCVRLWNTQSSDFALRLEATNLHNLQTTRTTHPVLAASVTTWHEPQNCIMLCNRQPCSSSTHKAWQIYQKDLCRINSFGSLFCIHVYSKVF